VRAQTGVACGDILFVAGECGIRQAQYLQQMGFHPVDQCIVAVLQFANAKTQLLYISRQAHWVHVGSLHQIGIAQRRGELFKKRLFWIGGLGNRVAQADGFRFQALRALGVLGQAVVEDQKRLDGFDEARGRDLCARPTHIRRRCGDGCRSVAAE